MKTQTCIRLALILTAAMATGCAVPTTGVIPRGDDMFTVTRQGSSAWVSTDSLKTAALQEADMFCNSRGKRMKFMYNKDIPAGPLGRWPESEVLFRCE